VIGHFESPLRNSDVDDGSAAGAPESGHIRTGLYSWHKAMATSTFQKDVAFGAGCGYHPF